MEIVPIFKTVIKDEKWAVVTRPVGKFGSESIAYKADAAPALHTFKVDADELHRRLEEAGLPCRVTRVETELRIKEAR